MVSSPSRPSESRKIRGRRGQQPTEADTGIRVTRRMTTVTIKGVRATRTGAERSEPRRGPPAPARSRPIPNRASRIVVIKPTTPPMTAGNS